jgi:hypothetical protein
LSRKEGSRSKCLSKDASHRGRMKIEQGMWKLPLKETFCTLIQRLILVRIMRWSNTKKYTKLKNWKTQTYVSHMDLKVVGWWVLWLWKTKIVNLHPKWVKTMTMNMCMSLLPKGKHQKRMKYHYQFRLARVAINQISIGWLRII